MIQFSTPSADVTGSYIAESRAQLRQAHDRIVHCINQLGDDHMHWRPGQGMNTLSNIILHLCGNLRQWTICPITGDPDERDRPGEFADRTHYGRQALLERLASVVAEADAAMSRITTAQQLTRPKRVQGFDINVLIALYDGVSHLKGHSQEIVYITRMLLGDRYRFLFVPGTKEMGA